MVYYLEQGSSECSEIKIGSNKWAACWQRNQKSTGRLCPLAQSHDVCPTYLCPLEGSRTRRDIRASCPRGTELHLQTVLLPSALFSVPCSPQSKSGPAASLSSRSFEGNLNIYKQLAIKLPDSQIQKVGDDTACGLPEVFLLMVPTDPVPQLAF